MSFDNHIRSVRRVVDLLGLESVVAVGHDSGGLIVRHALADDDRLRALVLIDTEQSTGVSLKFRTFVAGRRIPGFGHALAWLAGRPRLRRNGLVFGDAFVDRSHLDGEFAEFFLEPLHGSPDHRRAASRILRSFGYRYLRGLDELHGRIRVPVHLIWGEADRFFPVARAADMVGSFPDARLTVIEGAGLFAHEERPAEVAAALLTTVTGSESA